MLVMCSDIRATIYTCDYKDATESAHRGDFVYLDPPYDPVSYTSNFTAYTTDGFGREDQEQRSDNSGQQSGNSRKQGKELLGTLSHCKVG